MNLVLKHTLQWAWQNTRNWKTTATGATSWLLALALLAGYIGGDDPTHTGEVADAVKELPLKDILAYILFFLGLQGWVARDANVSSKMTKIEE